MKSLSAIVFAAALSLVAGCKRPLQFTPDALPDADVGKPYRAEVAVSGNSTPVGGMNAEGLPPGLTLHFTRDDKSAVIDGTPVKAGTYPVKVTAWCFGTNISGQTGEHGYRIVVR